MGLGKYGRSVSRIYCGNKISVLQYHFKGDNLMNKDEKGTSIIILTLALALFVTVLSACGAADRAGAVLTGYSTHCIEGVKYVQFANGASVMHNTDGTVKTCGTQ
jgi:hypothetical protein